MKVESEKIATYIHAINGNGSYDYEFVFRSNTKCIILLNIHLRFHRRYRRLHKKMPNMIKPV